MFNFLKNIFRSTNSSASLDPVQIAEALLVDVRNPHELKSGQVARGINIPLSQVADHIEKFKNQKHIILYCVSGSRADRAMNILRAHGITNVTNGGSWKDVDKLVRNA